MIDINELAREIHQQNVEKGWWEGEENQCICTKLQLVSTEIAEATEAERKDLMDSHLPHRKGGEVELADAMIRVLDLGGYLNLNYCENEKPYVFIRKDATIGKLHLCINLQLIKLSDALIWLDFRMHSHLYNKSLSADYSELVDSIIDVCKVKNYDLWGAVTEKLEYNRKRKDHERSERAKPGGKKF